MIIDYKHFDKEKGTRLNEELYGFQDNKDIYIIDYITRTGIIIHNCTLCYIEENKKKLEQKCRLAFLIYDNKNKTEDLDIAVYTKTREFGIRAGMHPFRKYKTIKGIKGKMADIYVVTDDKIAIAVDGRVVDEVKIKNF